MKLSRDSCEILCMPSYNALQNCQYRSESHMQPMAGGGHPNLPKIRLQNRTRLNGFSVKLEQHLITHTSASNMLQNPSCCGQKSLLYRFTLGVTKQTTSERIHQHKEGKKTITERTASPIFSAQKCSEENASKFHATSI